MQSQRIQFLLPFAALVAALINETTVVAFSPARTMSIAFLPRSTVLCTTTTSSQFQFPFQLASSGSVTEVTTDTTPTAPGKFIETELRGAAMKLHTRMQAPKEGEAPAAQPAQAHVPTHANYLSFLVDSLHVYQALEEIVNSRPELAVFRDTGMERTNALEKDIEFMVQEYGLERPEPGCPGGQYAKLLREIESTPELVCHYYNFYFAHTAGGRMIGKQMSALLLDKLTLEFYKWDGDLNEIKARVKDSIETMAAGWTLEEKAECVSGTAGAFKFGGAVNSYLSGGRSPH